MRLSVETYVPRERFGDEKAIAMIKEAGFDCLDYSFYGAKDEKNVLGDDYLQRAEALKKVLVANDIVCNQSHAPFNVKYGEEMSENNPKYREVVRSMEAASILGAEHIVVHAIPVPEPEMMVDYNVQYYNTLKPYCEKFGIRIAVENLFGYDRKRDSYTGLLGSPDVLCEVIEKLNSPWFVICVDIGHAALTGWEPEAFIRRLDGRVLKALHVQDNDYRADRHWFPYAGSLQWDEIMRALVEIGYEGDCTMEILGSLNKYENALLPEALKFAAITGKYLLEQANKFAVQ